MLPPTSGPWYAHGMLDPTLLGEVTSAQLFVRVVETGSFTRAGQEVGLSQSNVSRRVAALEDTLRVRLLTRTTRKVTPTEEGRAYYAQVKPALEAFVEAGMEARRTAGGVVGPVRVAAPGALGRRMVLPAVLEFVEQHPAVRPTLLLSDDKRDLVSEGVDFAVRVGTPSESSLVVRPLGRSPQVFVASPAYIERHGAPGGAETFAAHRWVVRVGPSGAVIGPATMLPPPTLSVDDVDGALDAARAGVGVAILPRWLVADALADGALVRVVPEAPEFSAPVVAVYPSRRSMPRRVRMLLDHCAAHVSAMLER